MKKFIRKTAIRTAAYFTCLTVVFAVVMLTMYAGKSGSSAAADVNMSALRTLLFLPFSVCFAAANTLMSCDRPGPFGKWVLHGILTVVPAYLCLILPGITESAGSQKLIGFVLVLIGYALSVAVIFISRARVRRIRAMEEEYRKNGKK